MTPTALLSLKVAGIALAGGLVLGAWAASAFYGPRIDLERERNETLGERLREQNRGIEALKTAEEDLAEQLRKAMQLSAARRREADRRAQELLALERPQGVDECQAASDLIRSELAR